MRISQVLLALAAAAALHGVPSAAAQNGFALKGGLVYNSSEVQSDRADLALDDAAGFHVGAEYILPAGLGVGVSGYTAGAPGDFSWSEGSLVVLGEANYVVDIPFFPVTPYGGIHVGLGTFALSDFEEGTARPQVDTGDRGWQVGLRFQPASIVGIDAQYRRVSGSLQGAQGSTFETSQFLIGLTIF